MIAEMISAILDGNRVSVCLGVGYITLNLVSEVEGLDPSTITFWEVV